MSVRVQEADFDVGAEIAALSAGRTDIGAVVSFTGLVRGEASGRSLNSMHLEHYPGMTEAELVRVEEEASSRWPLQATRIIHRYGDLKPGENIVLVIAASAHRQAAFEAAQFMMDFLKTKAPFWKKETDTSGAGDWVDARDSDDAALERWSDS